MLDSRHFVPTKAFVTVEQIGMMMPIGRQDFIEDGLQHRLGLLDIAKSASSALM